MEVWVNGYSLVAGQDFGRAAGVKERFREAQESLDCE